MSISEQRKRVNELLKQLNVESRVRSHNSVNISFGQMLAYIDKAMKSIPAGDIKKLLATYRSMVEMFYTQFELTLLMEITKYKDIQEQADSVIKYIEGLRDNSPAKATLEQVTPQLLETRDIARIEYDRLSEKYPTLLQNALNKLRDEWQRLNSLAVASQALTEDENLDRALKAVVEVAAHSVGVEAERIVIVPGTAFALNFFTYLDNLAVLTIPIYSVQSLWEWSIFWHELAGYKVRRLEKSATIEKVRKKLTDFHQLYKVSDEQKRKELLDLITWDNEFCRTYLVGIFGKERPDLDDLGGFEHQFERMVLSLTAADKFQVYEQIKADGWCVDWFKELFEDAWSVLTIGEPFMVFFSDVLGRNAAKDVRHPPLKVRLSVAKEILKLVNPQTQVVNEPDLVEGFTAQQILKFVSLLRGADRQFENPNVDQLSNPRLSRQHIRDKLFEKVRDGIQQSIANWSEKFLIADNPLRGVTNNTKNLLEIFSDPEVGNWLSQLHEYEAKQIKASYKGLLKDRNYEQLLKLSFSEVDYHTPGDIQLLEGGTTYWVKPVDWSSTLWLTQRHPVGNGILPTEIMITEVNTQIDWKVKIADWNGWFKMIQ